MNERKIKLKTGEIWQERLVAGNGHSGVICFCDPYEEVLTYQNIELLMPTEEPRMTPPEVGSELQEARPAVLHMDATWNVHGRKRTYLYAYHPGMQLRITTPQQELEAYSRRMVGETGEIIMDYRGLQSAYICLQRGLRCDTVSGRRKGDTSRTDTFHRSAGDAAKIRSKKVGNRTGSKYEI